MRIGFRTWALVDWQGQFRFQSVAITGYGWKLLGVNRAEDCRGKSGGFVQPIPELNTAGLYHYYDAGKAQREYEGRGLLGACMCWGRIAGKDGEGMFRSEYAQILAVTEPNWDRFPKPPLPVLPKTLAEKLWMVAVNKQRAALLQTPDSFRAYVEALVQVLGIDATALDIEELHKKFEAYRSTAEEEYARYQQALAEWKVQMGTWTERQSQRFRAQMPFPVYSTVDDLMKYAQKFGELGPPVRPPRQDVRWWHKFYPSEST